MSKPPSESKLREYDETLRFCQVIMSVERTLAERRGESTAAAVFAEVPDFWRVGTMSFSASLRAVTTMCRDLLEGTADYNGDALAAWNSWLAEQRAPTMTAMRARHWKVAAKVVKRGRIRNDDEYYLVRGIVDLPDTIEEDQRRLLGLLEEYEASKR